MENETTKKKIERMLFSKVCQNCHRTINGTTAKHLEHTFRMHQMFCLKSKDPTNAPLFIFKKKDDDAGDVAPMIQ